MEHLQSGGRVQRHNLSGFDGVTYSSAIASYSHSPWHLPAFDCKRERATNEVAHCHPIARRSDTARLQYALRPSQPPSLAFLC